jgi:hypothetical protein
VPSYAAPVSLPFDQPDVGVLKERIPGKPSGPGHDVLNLLTFFCSPDDPPVKSQINTQHKKAQENLQVTGEDRRIYERKDIVFHEGGSIREASVFGPKPVLQRGQWADPIGKFDKYRPQEGGHMYPGQDPPLEDQKYPQDGKKNKTEMDKQHEVRKETKKHVAE